MRTKAVADMARDLGESAKTLGQGWRDQSTAIGGFEGGIGDDVLGAAFKGVYTPQRTTVQTNADTVPELLRRDADGATKASAMYVDASQRAAENLKT